MDLREQLFRARGITPVPFLVLVIYYARPNTSSMIVGTLFVILGELIMILGVGVAGGATRTRDVGAESLVTSGIFAHVRNPLYLGNFLLAGGVVVFSNALFPYLLILYILLFAFQYSMIVSLEEETLSKLFGKEYERYKSRVPRFIPAIRPYDRPSKHRFSLMRALRSERNTLIAIAISLLLIFAGSRLGILHL